MNDLPHMIKKKTLSDEIISRIQAYIIQNTMKVGDRLPTEQDMAEKFGVSRVSIREATKALNILGLIESAPRRGLTLGALNMDRLAGILSFQFALDDYPKELLLKTRLVIEIGSLQYAMEPIATDESLYRELIELCDELEHVSDVDAYIELDTKIHCMLVEASGVKPLVAFNNLLQVFFFRFRQSLLNQKKHWPASSSTHRAIIDALRDRNLSLAEELLRSHLNAHRKTDESDQD